MIRFAILCLAIAMVLSGPAVAETRTLNLTVEKGKVTNSDKTVRLTEGDKVNLIWTADQALELHLHGYDRKLNIKPGSEARMELDADLVGRFPIEVHGHSHGLKEKTILYLEIYPK